jgi:hypothetical protein
MHVDAATVYMYRRRVLPATHARSAYIARQSLESQAHKTDKIWAVPCVGSLELALSCSWLVPVANFTLVLTVAWFGLVAWLGVGVGWALEGLSATLDAGAGWQGGGGGRRRTCTRAGRVPHVCGAAYGCAVLRGAKTRPGPAAALRAARAPGFLRRPRMNHFGPRPPKRLPAARASIQHPACPAQHDKL